MNLYCITIEHEFDGVGVHHLYFNGEPTRDEVILRLKEDDIEFKHDYERLDFWEVKTPYDSTSDTLRHIKRVNQLLLQFASRLIHRAEIHDSSKLCAPEKALYDHLTPLLKDSEYGSPEYKQFLVDLKPALDHHYANNPHHPEYWENGIKGMDLVDLVEMAMDWKAASERHESGDIYKSVEINQKRFGYSDDIKEILTNTYKTILTEQ